MVSARRRGGRHPDLAASESSDRGVVAEGRRGRLRCGAGRRPPPPVRTHRRGRQSACQVLGVAADGLDRGGQDAVRIADRTPIRNGADVDAEPAAPAWVVHAGAVGPGFAGSVTWRSAPGDLGANRGQGASIPAAFLPEPWAGRPFPPPRRPPRRGEGPIRSLGPQTRILGGGVGPPQRTELCCHRQVGAPRSAPRAGLPEPILRGCHRPAIAGHRRSCPPPSAAPRHGPYPPARHPPRHFKAARAVASRIRSSSFSAVLEPLDEVGHPGGHLIGGTFSEDASPAISARSLARCRNESSPT